STVHTQRALKAAGIQEGFGPQYFRWDEDRKVFVCPVGKPLEYWKKHTKDRGRIYDWYAAQASDCAGCVHREQCVQIKQRQQGKGRLLQVLHKNPLVEAHRAKMETEQAKAAYRKRGEVAEFPNAW